MTKIPQRVAVGRGWGDRDAPEVVALDLCTSGPWRSKENGEFMRNLCFPNWFF